jgi:hypothetical protein
MHEVIYPEITAEVIEASLAKYYAQHEVISIKVEAYLGKLITYSIAQLRRIAAEKQIDLPANARCKADIIAAFAERYERNFGLTTLDKKIALYERCLQARKPYGD